MAKIFSNFIYDNSTKTFKLQPNQVEISKFAEKYATYIYSDKHDTFLAQGGEPSPVYLTVDMLRDNDKALIKTITDTYGDKNTFVAIIVENITRIMNYSSDFPIKEEDLITNVTTMQHLETRHYKVNDNNNDMQREARFNVDYLQSFKKLDGSLVTFAEKLETGKIITISKKSTRTQISDMCTYKYFGNSILVPYLEDDISELYGHPVAKGIRKNKPIKTKKNKKNKTRNKRNQKIKKNQNKGTKRT